LEARTGLRAELGDFSHGLRGTRLEQLRLASSAGEIRVSLDELEVQLDTRAALGGSLRLTALEQRGRYAGEDTTSTVLASDVARLPAAAGGGASTLSPRPAGAKARAGTRLALEGLDLSLRDGRGRLAFVEGFSVQREGDSLRAAAHRVSLGERGQEWAS